MLALLVSILISAAFAHEGHHHDEAPVKKEGEELAKINDLYVRSVKPIFQKSCFDCHSSATRFPWYASIPGIRQLIASDIAEARKHLDMSQDFPFAGHGTPIEDLQEVRKTVEEREMPPWRYWMLHSGTRLSEDEKSVILDWVQESLKLAEKKE